MRNTYYFRTNCIFIQLTLQKISRIEYIHSKGFIHRDIKPQNFLVGANKDSNTIYLIDFGLSKRYKFGKSNIHVPYNDHCSFAGTARYSSINTFMGIEQSRRDDLEAISYMLIYFIRGALPWQGIKAQNRQEKHTKVMEMKMSYPAELLCMGLESNHHD